MNTQELREEMDSVRRKLDWIDTAISHLGLAYDALKYGGCSAHAYRLNEFTPNVLNKKQELETELKQLNELAKTSAYLH